jgi:hypothetical protein
MTIFQFKIDAEISNMWFFKGGVGDKDSDKEMDEDDFINKCKGFMKKNYIYLTTDGKVVVKNLGVKKKSCSALSRKIFNDVLIPKIKEERKVEFSKTFFRNTINRLLEEDLNLTCIRYKVNPVNTYKNASQLQCQIARRYGSGIHFLIPNNKLGVGKDRFYCSVEEFKNNNLNINNIDLRNVWSELSYFIMEDKAVDLSNFG